MSSPIQDVNGDDTSLLHQCTSSVEPGGLIRSGSESSSSSSSRSSDWRLVSDQTMLPIWTANPQSPTEDCLVTSQRNNKLLESFHRKFSFTLFFVGFALVGMAAIFTSGTTVRHASEHVAILSRNREEMETKLRKTEQDMFVLKREILAMDTMIQQQQDLDAQTHSNANRQRALGELSLLQQRVKKESEQAQLLKSQVQKMSKDQLETKYGKGVHRVEIELVFPNSRDIRGAHGASKFVVELASSEIMPHSVHTFLEMVSSGLLDGCSFILNALHVLKAAPLPYDGTSAAEKAKAFSEAGLESVAFREYNEAYPHKQYTIGFAADGSPSFYINTEDNSEIHVGDPCFGKIVDGFDAVRRLESSPTRNGIWFEKRIGIKSARII